MPTQHPYLDRVDPELRESLQLSLAQLSSVVRVETPVGPCAEDPRITMALRNGVICMSQLIAAQTLTDETIRWPATWWEAVKERFLPAWAKQRWPVVFEVRRLNAKEFYPNIRRPPGQPFVTVAWVDSGRELVPGRGEDA